jgi:hypothetical protein
VIREIYGAGWSKRKGPGRSMRIFLKEVQIVDQRRIKAEDISCQRGFNIFNFVCHGKGYCISGGDDLSLLNKIFQTDNAT